jgi:hypothetical protein
MRVWLILLFLFFPLRGWCQHPADTTGFYHDLYHYSKDKKWLYVFYRTLFNVPQNPESQQVHQQPVDQNAHAEYRGKIIRKITIISLDPFGRSIRDTSVKPDKFIQKAGNALHFNTRISAIRSYLLFETGEPLIPLKLSESERLLRNSRFIRDAVIRVSPAEGSSGEVDVTVITQDLWTLTVSTVVTSDRLKVRLTEHDMFGLGHRFSNRVVTPLPDITDRNPEFSGNYLIPNIRNSYISAEVNYLFNDRESTKGIHLLRPFYSPLTKYAGGITYENSAVNDSLSIPGSGYRAYRYKLNETGLWMGRSFPLRKGETREELSTRLVITAGYTRFRYPELSTNSDEVRNVFSPVDLVLAGIGYSNRKYFTDRYIFQFGEKEDIPSGRIFRVTPGYEIRSERGSVYLGLEAGASGYLNNGSYVSSSWGVSSFFYEGAAERGLFRGDVFWFSPLQGGDRWKIRWFGNVNLTGGLNRLTNEVIALNSGDWIPGYRSSYPVGTTRLAANITMVLFNPFQFIGFRISPVVFAGAGMIGDSSTPIHESKLYKGIGGGFAFTNVYLVQSDFKILFGYYPDITGDQTRLSSFDAWEFQFRDFDFGRPGVMPFD